MKPTLKTAVLIIAYKRVETTRMVLERVSQVKPQKLYVSQNAPNPSKPDDQEKCDAVKNLFESLNWDVDLYYRRADSHLPARLSITSGISWFFEHEPKGVILEDDCVVEPGFFFFCEELLDRYKGHEKVMHIGASNFQDQSFAISDSYYVSRFNHIWGWAGWASVWNEFELNSIAQIKPQLYQFIDSSFSRWIDRLYWKIMVFYLKRGQVDTWDYQYMFYIWSKGGVTILPAKNQVQNIGFGNEATNTQTTDSDYANQMTTPLQFPLQHPEFISINEKADQYTADHVYKVKPDSYFAFIRLWGTAFLPGSFRKWIKKLFS